jgi:hypothetical protein
VWKDAREDDAEVEVEDEDEAVQLRREGITAVSITENTRCNLLARPFLTRSFSHSVGAAHLSAKTVCLLILSGSNGTWLQCVGDVLVRSSGSRVKQVETLFQVGTCRFFSFLSRVSALSHAFDLATCSDQRVDHAGKGLMTSMTVLMMRSTTPTTSQQHSESDRITLPIASHRIPKLR